MLEATQDASAWCGVAQDTWTPPDCLRTMSLAAAASQRDGYVSSSRPRSDGRSTCSPRRGSRKRKSAKSVVQARAAHKETEATRPPKKGLLKQLQCMTSALDRWQAAETSQRRAVEGSKKSATMREDRLVVGADGWFRVALPRQQDGARRTGAKSRPVLVGFLPNERHDAAHQILI